MVVERIEVRSEFEVEDEVFDVLRLVVRIYS